MATYEKIVAAFDNSASAQNAVAALTSGGFQKSDISVVDSSSGGNVASQPGFWHHATSGSVDQHEAQVYSDVVGKGGSVLTLRAPTDKVASAVNILHTLVPVDVNQRAQQLGATVPAAASSKQRIGKDGADVVRLAEEQLNVGKQKYSTGTVRVRRFTVEKPAEAQVTLHEEHATIARKLVSDPSLARDIDWSDKEIAVTETAERPTVSKTAKVYEEVDVGKAGSEKTQTVKDKVRQQKVEIEREGSDDDPDK